MYACEKIILNKLFEFVTEEMKLRVIILDPGAPMEMAQILIRILTSRMNKIKLLAPNILVMGTMLDETETWKRNWLERFRHDIIHYDPVFRAEVLFNSSDSSMEMGIVSSGDGAFTKHLLH